MGCGQSVIAAVGPLEIAPTPLEKANRTPAEAPTADVEILAERQAYRGLFEALDLYFPSGGSTYIQTSDNEAFIRDAQDYLKHHPDKKLYLTGHTDNTGSPSYNVALSKKRAESVKRILVRHGLPPAQLVVEGRGQAEPKADNATVEGRTANRRCTVRIQ
ncbi:outer membrane protein OmpA-like peptidoglycan-associated protein [Dyadobacter jejuensis]|uniref:Outer membrane protein OmpA-like peptidoglycan-associated protein n=2 Tax=Dyadobacter jejuensis TaxID=1082580 RepID=A0A316ARL5_9BACT|nr:outer membrane protein OmpA-like peptidoglycan-associated protein [Dyadobacter jejuensis]